MQNDVTQNLFQDQAISLKTFNNRIQITTQTTKGSLLKGIRKKLRSGTQSFLTVINPPDKSGTKTYKCVPYRFEIQADKPTFEAENVFVEWVIVDLVGTVFSLQHVF